MAGLQTIAAPKKKSSLFVRLLKGAAFLLVLAVVAITGIGLFVLDGKYDVVRTTTIKASPEAVHAQVGDLREWPNWLPFTKHDPSVKTTIEKPTGVDAHQHWTCDHGVGELTFTATDDQKGIEYNMLFDKTYASKGTISYAKEGDATKVTWRMTGQNTDFVGKWMAAAMGMMVGPMFDEGLADLKAKVETKK